MKCVTVACFGEKQPWRGEVTAKLIINRAKFGDNVYSTIKIVRVRGAGERRRATMTSSRPLVAANVFISRIFTFLLCLYADSYFCNDDGHKIRVPLWYLNKTYSRIKQRVNEKIVDVLIGKAETYWHGLYWMKLCLSFGSKYNNNNIYRRWKRQAVRGTTCNRTPKIRYVYLSSQHKSAHGVYLTCCFYSRCRKHSYISFCWGSNPFCMGTSLKPLNCFRSERGFRPKKIYYNLKYNHNLYSHCKVYK